MIVLTHWKVAPTGPRRQHDSVTDGSIMPYFTAKIHYRSVMLDNGKMAA
jgi:hypothetical protein